MYGVAKTLRTVVQFEIIQGVPMRKKSRKKKATEEAQEERGDSSLFINVFFSVYDGIRIFLDRYK